MASGEGEPGAGEPPPLDGGGLGGYQKPRAHRRAGDWRHQGHSATGEFSGSPRHGLTVLGLLIRGQRPNHLREKNRQVTGWPPTGPLPGRRPWLCALRWYHQSPRHVRLPAPEPSGVHTCLPGPTLLASASANPRPGTGWYPAAGTQPLSIFLPTALNFHFSVFHVLLYVQARVGI